MPASTVKVTLGKILCNETESYTVKDKFYVTCASAFRPKQGEQVPGFRRFPSGATWELNNGEDVDPQEPLFYVTDFEGQIELDLGAYDQDLATSLSDEIIDRAVDRFKDSISDVAGALADTGIGAPIAAAVLLARPITNGVGGILKAVTTFDNDDKLGSKLIRIDTDRGPRTDTITWYATDDGADYEIKIEVKVVSLI